MQNFLVGVSKVCHEVESCPVIMSSYLAFTPLCSSCFLFWIHLPRQTALRATNWDKNNLEYTERRRSPPAVHATEVAWQIDAKRGVSGLSGMDFGVGRMAVLIHS